MTTTDDTTTVETFTIPVTLTARLYRDKAPDFLRAAIDLADEDGVLEAIVNGTVLDTLASHGIPAMNGPEGGTYLIVAVD